MKFLTSLLLFLVMTLGLANCGSDNDFNGNPGAIRTADATAIEFDAGSDVITWSDDSNNIFVGTSSRCVRGLRSDADDNVADEEAELKELIETSTIGTGSETQRHSDSIYLTIRYKDGTSRTFNLREDLATTSEETLSRGDEIIDFFERVSGEISIGGHRICSNGK
ncbi:MAG: hypothetical protein AAF203_00070 [Pseudomonadota bacterium]